jgi:hypothetical protein
LRSSAFWAQPSKRYRIALMPLPPSLPPSLPPYCASCGSLSPVADVRA